MTMEKVFLSLKKRLMDISEITATIEDNPDPDLSNLSFQQVTTILSHEKNLSFKVRLLKLHACVQFVNP